MQRKSAMSGKLLKMMGDVRLIATDFDGVHTDGKVYVDQNGVESVVCSRRDGLGIAIWKKHGFEVCVISTEANSVVEARCNKLKIPFYQKAEHGLSKLKTLKDYVERLGLDWEDVMYVGDDINDIPCLRWVRLPVTVADAHPDVKEVAKYVTTVPGGQHALRQIIELVLHAKGLPIEF